MNVWLMFAKCEKRLCLAGKLVTTYKCTLCEQWKNIHQQSLITATMNLNNIPKTQTFTNTIKNIPM